MNNNYINTQDSPFFSLIVPVYNQENYLSSCIETLQKQTFSSYEIIIVNDGSTDNSAAICDKYQEKNNNIKVIHQKNKGVFCARVKGLEQAIGQFILMIDSDDKLREDALEILFDTINKNNPDVILFLAATDEDYRTRWSDLPFNDGEIFIGKQKREIYNILCGSDALNSMSFKCVKKNIITIDAFSKYGEGVREGEDLIHSLYICDKAQKILFLKQNLYFYRINNECSRTHTFNDKHYEDVKKAMSIRKMYAEKWDTDGSLLKSYDKFSSVIYYNLILYLITADIGWKQIKSYLQIIFKEGYFKEAESTATEHKNPKHVICCFFIKHKLTLCLIGLHFLYKFHRR